MLVKLPPTAASTAEVPGSLDLRADQGLPSLVAETGAARDNDAPASQLGQAWRCQIESGVLDAPGHCERADASASPSVELEALAIRGMSGWGTAGVAIDADAAALEASRADLAERRRHLSETARRIKP